MPLKKHQVYIVLMLTFLPCLSAPSNPNSNCPIERFNCARGRYTECVVCKYSFEEHFHWTQKKFLVEWKGLEQVGQWKASTLRLNKEFYTELIVPRNGSKTLGEGLEQVRQWKASKWLWNKELYIE